METLSERVTRYGENSYLEVSRKRLMRGGVAKDYLVITRGFCDGPNTKRSSRFVNFPDDPALRRWLADALLADEPSPTPLASEAAF